MVIHVCERCGYSTARKCNMDTHFKRKSPCFHPPQNDRPNSQNVRPNSQNVRSGTQNVRLAAPPDSRNQCDACRRVFSRSDGLKRHITEGTCKGVPPKTCPHCLMVFTTYSAKCQHVKRGTCVARAVQSAPAPATDTGGPAGNHIVTNNNNIGTQNNINNNVTININAFCAEDIQHLLSDKRRMNGYVSAAYRAIPKMIKDVYFDAAHPENQTVQYPNMRASHMQVATREGDWEFRDKAEVIRDMVESNLEHLCEHAESRECDVHPFVLKKFKECQEMLDAFLQETGDNARAAAVWRRVKKDVEMAILSNRKVVADSSV